MGKRTVAAIFFVVGLMSVTLAAPVFQAMPELPALGSKNLRMFINPERVTCFALVAARASVPGR